MVDRQHVARAEATAEKVDDEGQHRPPGRGAAEESGDDEHGAEEASHAFVRDVAARNLEYREEGEDVGDHHDEIGDRQPEDRGEVLPQRRLARPVAAYLRYGVLGEDVDADDYHEDAAYHAQQGVVLFDLGLEHRVKNNAAMAMKVSAQATPRPETIPERRLFDRVRWMHSTATGPTVIDAATPTQMPRNITSKISNPIFFGCGVSGNKDTKTSDIRQGRVKKGAADCRKWPIC